MAAAMSDGWRSPAEIHHEAGHAVLFWATGRRFRHVTIRPRKPGYRGYVYPYRLGQPRELRTERDCIEEMMRRAGGHAAEHYFSTRQACAHHVLEQWFATALAGHSNDFDLIEFVKLGQILDNDFHPHVLPGQKGPRTWIEPWAEAEQVVADQWSSVQAVASELAERRTLTGPAVFRIAEAASR